MTVLKESVVKALAPSEAVVLAHVLEQLGNMTLDANARWRVLQIQHVLLAKDRKGQEEP